jgi:putative ABC transport system permease protein
MRLMAMDPLVLSNIAGRPGRALASVGGIALGVVLILVTVGLARGMLRSAGERQANVRAEILFQPRGAFHAGVTTSPLSLPVAYAEALRKMEGVRAATPVGRFVQSGAGGLGFELVEGVVFPSYVEMTGIRFEEGRAPAGDREAALDRSRSASTGKEVGDFVELLGHRFQVVGVYGPEVGARVKIPLSAMQELMGNEGKCSFLLVKTETPGLQDAVAERIDAALPGNQIVFTRDIPSYFEKGFPSLTIFLDVVVGLSTIISTLITLLALYTAVLERTRQIGILKSLGASKAFIVGGIQKEAVTLSVAGVLLGVGGSLIVQTAIHSTTSLIVEIEPRWVAIATLVAVAGGSLGALYPALRAAHQDAVDALAYEA